MVPRQYGSTNLEHIEVAQTALSYTACCSWTPSLSCFRELPCFCVGKQRSCTQASGSGSVKGIKHVIRVGPEGGGPFLPPV
jgi:hypothetical protein